MIIIIKFCFQDQPAEDDLSDVIYEDEVEPEADEGLKVGPLTLKELF